MSTGPVYCPSCQCELEYTIGYGYQCPNCRRFWDGHFPINMTHTQTSTTKLSE